MSLDPIQEVQVLPRLALLIGIPQGRRQLHVGGLESNQARGEYLPTANKQRDVPGLDLLLGRDVDVALAGRDPPRRHLLHWVDVLQRSEIVRRKVAAQLLERDGPLNSVSEVTSSRLAPSWLDEGLRHDSSPIGARSVVTVTWLEPNRPRFRSSSTWC